MKVFIISLFVMGILIISCQVQAQGVPMQNIYDFKVKTMEGTDKSMADYKGRCF